MDQDLIAYEGWRFRLLIDAPSLNLTSATIESDDAGGGPDGEVG